MRDPLFAHFEEEFGIHLHGAEIFAKDEDGTSRYLKNIHYAEDAQPELVTVSNAGIPSFLTTVVDPQLIRVLTAKNKAAEIGTEVRKGTWTDQTAMFPMIESAGEVSSYGDFNNNGKTSANTNFPQRQAYLYQTILEYGELGLARAGVAKIDWANELKISGTMVLNKFQNQSWFRGVAGLANYGIQNEPDLSAPISPALKGWGGVGWFNGGVVQATANEIFTDIQSVVTLLVEQSDGLVSAEDELVLCLSPKSKMAFTTTNGFNVNVWTLLKENFPKMRVVDAVQYGVANSQNTLGLDSGEFLQIWAPKVEGQDSLWVAFNEKLRTHPVIRQLSSYQQKMTQGTWGAIIRQPFAVAGMLGI